MVERHESHTLDLSLVPRLVNRNRRVDLIVNSGIMMVGVPNAGLQPQGRVNIGHLRRFLAVIVHDVDLFDLQVVHIRLIRVNVALMRVVLQEWDAHCNLN